LPTLPAASSCFMATCQPSAIALRRALDLRAAAAFAHRMKLRAACPFLYTLSQ
jgi:hypothetical protein